MRVGVRSTAGRSRRSSSPPDPGFFLRLLTLPAGRCRAPARFAYAAGGGPECRRQPPARGRRPSSSSTSSRLRPSSSAFDTGWHEPELQPEHGSPWRWSSASATTRVHHAGQDLMVTIDGESPRRSFATAPRVMLRAGGQVLAQASPAEDFTLTARVPAAALEQSRRHLHARDRPGVRAGGAVQPVASIAVRWACASIGST